MVRALQAVIVSAVIVMMALLTVSVVGTLADSSTAGLGGNETTSLGVTGGSADFSDKGVESFTRARTSLNTSVQLTGADDSNVTVESDANLGHDLSVCTYGALNSTVVTNNNDGLLLATQEAILWYNGTDDVYNGYFYNTSSRNSFRANVSAASPTSPTLVCLNHANQSLNVSANTTTGTAVTTGASNIADYPENVSNWNGTVEETRLYDRPLNGSQRSDYVAEPVLAVNGDAPAARVTYDSFQAAPSTYNVYFASGTADVSNATVVTGRRGPRIEAGTDFSVTGDTITILAGGALNQTGEVLYINYVAAADESFSNIVTALSGSIGLLAVVPLLLISLAIIARLRDV